MKFGRYEKFLRETLLLSSRDTPIYTVSQSGRH